MRREEVVGGDMGAIKATSANGWTRREKVEGADAWARSEQAEGREHWPGKSEQKYTSVNGRVLWYN